MKKQIPQKVANKVYSKLLPENQNRSKAGWLEEILFKSNTNSIHNRFFKNKVSQFIYKCSCDWCLRGKLVSTRKRIEKWESKLIDYIQEQ